MIIMIVGLILVAGGIFASINLLQRLQVNQAPAESSEEYVVKTDVVVVTRDLFLGDTLTSTDVELASVPVEIAPRTAIANLDGIEGKIIKTDLVQGEMLLSHNLADPTNNNKDLSYILSEDHVLMAFPAEDLMSRESMVQRGDIVDILATFTQEIEKTGEIDPATGQPLEPETRTFTVDSLQRVGVTALIVAVSEETAANDTSLVASNDGAAPEKNARTLAYLLALNPRDALILKHLKDTNAIFDIVLRAPTSTVQFDFTPISEEYIIEFYGLGILP
jgi:Flp pilus assembly protein CpaB